jgi:hypothetical protein
MNRQTLAGLLNRAVFLAGVLLLALALQPASAQKTSTDPELTAHEWGTFTSVGGDKGVAVRWLPFTSSNDLPPFVEHFGQSNLKLGLQGTVRMETPVLYFYASRPTTVSVHVSFSKGLITEWYPHAEQVAPNRPVYDVALFNGTSDGSISWNNVSVEQNASSSDFPRATGDNHYYAARETNASALLVKAPSGAQHERFLFYRGVSSFSVPIAARLATDGSVELENLTSSVIPNAILFERHGQGMGYSILGSLETKLTAPLPQATESNETPASDLEQMLVSQGLFPDEAHAMVTTWSGSWFDDGARIIYIVPRPFVDSILPLTIAPVPQQITRVFVGRIELVTPATEKAVETAYASGDQGTLAKYGRFLIPILERMIRESSDTSRVAQLRHDLDSAYSAVLLQARN